MVLSAGKLVPRAIVLATVGYCVWPTLADFASQPETKPAKKLVELTASLLTPTLPSSPDRDPFRPANSKPAAKATAAKTTGIATAAAAKKDTPNAATETSAADKVLGGAAKGRAVSEPAVNPLGGLVLNATCIRGDMRMALINGKLYQPKDKLPAAAPGAPPCVVAEILPYKVLLECRGKTLELCYSDRVTAGGGPAAKHAAPASPAADSKSSRASAATKTKSGGKSKK